MSESRQTELHPLTARVEELFIEFGKQIPRRSSNEQAAAEFVASFAESLPHEGIEVFRQYTTTEEKREIHNIIVKKPATPDRINSAPIILQAHMDMVCEPKTSKEHDFDTDPITIYEETDEDGVVWIRACKKDGEITKTTLGADDGIGVACMLAILEAGADQLSHPPIEAIFTSDEEAEMSGAEYLDVVAPKIEAKRMINIDTEQEGVFFNGCAGGLNVTSIVELVTEEAAGTLACYTLSVTGLIGGHSGLMIGERRANANRLMGRLLDKLQETLGKDIRVSWIKGGEYPNAIPVNCTAQIAVAPERKEELKAVVDNMYDCFKSEYKGTDASPDRYDGDDRDQGLHLNLDELAEKPQSYMTADTLDKIVTLLTALPNDVIAMHTEHTSEDDLVETSSNMGMVYPSETGKELMVVCFVRSCFESKKQMVARQIERIAKYVGADIKTSSNFPAWTPDSSSALRQVMESLYDDEFKDLGKVSQTKSIHAGLECGYFSRNIPGLDCIAIGPTILGAHTIEERLQKDTINLIVRLLARVLKDIDGEIQVRRKVKVMQPHKEHINCMCMK